MSRSGLPIIEAIVLSLLSAPAARSQEISATAIAPSASEMRPRITSPARLADLTAGRSIEGADNVKVGYIGEVCDGMVIVHVGDTTTRLPVSAFGVAGASLGISLSAEQLKVINGMIAQNVAAALRSKRASPVIVP